MENLIGEKIVAARKYIGYTRKKLADEIGVHPEQLRHWENGTRNPKLEAINKIAFACELDPIFFYIPNIPIEDLKFHSYEYTVPFCGQEACYLTDENHDRIISFAEEKHMSPNAAVNYILDYYFDCHY